MLELVLCTLIWGAAFIAQKAGSEHFGPFTVICGREFLAAAFLLCCAVRRRDGWNRTALVGGTLSGLFIFAGELCQQIGVTRTSPGVAAFLTTNYVLLVPLFGSVLGKRPGWGVWGGAVLALAGTYFLCFPTSSLVPDPSSLNPGCAWILLCAVFFALQILVVERFVRDCDPLKFSLVQVTVAGLVALPFVFLPGELSRMSWSGTVHGLPSLLFLGIAASGLSYLLQNRGQVKVSAALAAIILSMEGVFAVLFGWLLLGDVLSLRQLAGCALVLTAVILSQLLSATGR